MSKESWEKILNPEVLRNSLISISLYISAFELFKGQIISKPEMLFMNGFDEKYKDEVLSRSKSKLYASLLWIKDQGGIDEGDIEAFDKIRKHRNQLAHEILNYVTEANKNVDAALFSEMIDLLAKIEKWWFEYFELAVQPEILPNDASIDDVIPGPIWTLKMMLDIALGSDEDANHYYKEWCKIHS